ncbi:hypothetical protein C3K47_14950 [Solitalea longa]|uniref:Antitoxin n=1 Tax=Solitalea longa TaxID=2079460 RepID=A0A2S4ZYD1_9SPHI|nr:DUF6364 family protein [Solitalea longa]POY35361.1 hypothetical protein C3K47_14950 [Solitalea longa]
MDSKLTLSIKKEIIEKAKQYAKLQNTSVSKLIENYLSKVSADSKDLSSEALSPLVKELSGVLKLSPEFDLKKDYGNYLEDKYR